MSASEWSDILAPIVRKFEVAAAFDCNATWNPEGSRAMAELIKEMAAKLDKAVQLQIGSTPDHTLLDLAASALPSPPSSTEEER